MNSDVYSYAFLRAKQVENLREKHLLTRAARQLTTSLLCEKTLRVGQLTASLRRRDSVRNRYEIHIKTFRGKKIKKLLADSFYLFPLSSLFFCCARIDLCAQNICHYV